MLTLRAARRGLVCRGLRLSPTQKKKKKVGWNFTPLTRWCVFAIQIFAHSPLRCKAPFEAEEFYQDQWQRERAAWQRERQCCGISNRIFKQPGNPKSKMYANGGMFFHIDVFHDLGLAYSGRAERVLGFGYITQNYSILDLLNKHLQGGKDAVSQIYF